ncbi:MAG: GNAT family N-acetyltransferase [Algicola sp.]|nr:GNAT family N-acetyltransferase [Algicola sp.]
MQWYTHTFNQLTTKTLYDILKLRIDVFVVEQTCYYPDLDGIDCNDDTLHIYAFENDEIIAYLRCLAPGVVYEGESAIGRVVIAEQARGRSLGHELIQQGIKACEAAWPDNNIHMAAQEHLQKYYHQHDFKTIGEMFLEDDIPHISMVREAKTKS